MSNEKPIIAQRQDKMKLGIIGHGFVGQAVDYGFSTASVEKFIVDPKYTDGNTLQDLCEWEPNCVFVCAPTPANDDGSADCSIVEEAVIKLVNLTDSFIVIKSTIPPDVVDSLMNLDEKIIYCPEFLTEGNAKENFIHAPYRIVGVSHDSQRQYIEGLFQGFSICSHSQIIPMSGVEAAFFKYSINTFLAMKLTFFNQLYDYMGDFGGNYYSVAKAIGVDSRIGPSHKTIPGTDGKRGFGGACFPKDLDAFIHFIENNTEVEPKLLKTVKEINSNYRSQYNLGDREKANNIRFDNE
jgi:UDPglucose 6-dehydrogenase